ncbi:MAG TPA: hemerythrin family protein [Candidatus Omnitrophota bacterium]|nr:hemerythrin family protein [Candidatus Omnitrophota bacterium]
MLVWEEGYKIGQEEMDAEHLILFSILNQLNINIQNDMAGACVADVLGALGSYIDYHFAHEEALMKSWGYPGLEGHSAKHHEFMNEIARLRREADGGDMLQAGLKVRAFVLDWLLSHILESDAEYAAFIAAKAKDK